MREFLKPPRLTEAAARAGYGPAVRCDDLILIAGQTARADDGTVIGIGDAEAQAVRIYERLQQIVEFAGGSLRDVVQLRAYITDRAYRSVYNAVTRRYFPGPDFPCSALIVVAGLAEPDFLMEVEAVAHIPSPA